MDALDLMKQHEATHRELGKQLEEHSAEHRRLQTETQGLLCCVIASWIGLGVLTAFVVWVVCR